MNQFERIFHGSVCAVENRSDTHVLILSAREQLTAVVKGSDLLFELLRTK